MMRVTLALLGLTNVMAQGESGPPPTLFRCNPENYQCVECEKGHEGGCNYEVACKASCGKFSPLDLIGKWRGLNVKDRGVKKFDFGEKTADFKNNTVDLAGSSYPTSTTAGDTFQIVAEDGKKQSFTYTLVGNLKYTTAIGMSTFRNATYPDSFAQGMRSNDTTNFVFFQCNKWGKKDTCNFEKTQILNQLKADEKRENLISNLLDGQCARCDKATETCEDCSCGTGPDCMPADQCKEQCEPKGPKYKCDWMGDHPVCKEDPEGTMS